ncbi:MAG: HD domain-containing protein [Chloroflexi bacterium]|nr:HD domain-containing protein [Chloroflexota bacterium]
MSRPPFSVPPEVMQALEELWSAGHAGYLVGGGVRDALLGRTPHDPVWDLATDAIPERALELFPGGTYENRFGTVLAGGVEVTTFRRDHAYGDHRRPDRVTFTDSIEEDLARRDFTVNAVAWGRAAGGQEAGWVDPTGGRADLDARLLRAVGDPELRFGEDALRLVRAARIAAQVGLTIHPDTEAAMSERAGDVSYLATERIGRELRRMLDAEPPSAAFRILERTGLLRSLFPELAAQLGVVQDKIPGQDLWDHSLATLDAAAALAPADPIAKLAALLHDTGKPETAADGHFLGHEEAGARIAQTFLSRLGFGSQDVRRVVRLVRHHMWSYVPAWGDAAVRRFMRRVGVDLVDDLLRLREADNVGSGWPAEGGGVAELRARIAEQRHRRPPLSLADLAVDGNAVMASLGREPGPWLGRTLERLLDSVISDPERNTPERLLADARTWAEKP